MITRPLLAVSLAMLSVLTACGGGQAADDGASSSGAMVRAAGVGGNADTAAATPAIGGIGGTGAPNPGIGGIGGTGSPQDTIGGIGGTGITDASVASCGLTHVLVTLTGLRLNQNAAAAAAGAGWVDLALATPLHIDLLTLSTGAVLPLDVSSLPDGVYTQVQLMLAPNGAGAAPANAVVDAHGNETALSLPGTLRLATTLTISGGRATGSWTPSAVCQAVAPGAAARQ